MFTIDKVHQVLDEISAELPSSIFDGLNGGVALLDDVRLNPVSTNGDLYIMGEYCRGGSMGCYINIYYGSICRVYPSVSEVGLRIQLRRILLHELTHHLEHQAGDRSLDREDAVQIDEYLGRH